MIFSNFACAEGKSFLRGSQAYALPGNFEKLCCLDCHYLHPRHISVVFYSQQS